MPYFCPGKYSVNFDIFLNKTCIVKKINVSFIVHLCPGKYSFNFEIF